MDGHPVIIYINLSSLSLFTVLRTILLSFGPSESLYFKRPVRLQIIVQLGKTFVDYPVPFGHRATTETGEDTNRLLREKRNTLAAMADLRETGGGGENDFLLRGGCFVKRWVGGSSPKSVVRNVVSNPVRTTSLKGSGALNDGDSLRVR